MELGSDNSPFIFQQSAIVKNAVDLEVSQHKSYLVTEFNKKKYLFEISIEKSVYSRTFNNNKDLSG